MVFIHNALQQIHKQLIARGGSLHTYFGSPPEVWKGIIAEAKPHAVFANEDYEPYARKRDTAVAVLLQAAGSVLHLFKDQVVFAPDEALKADGKPYTIFTPYYNRRMALLGSTHLESRPSEQYLGNVLQEAPATLHSLADTGFKPLPQNELHIPGSHISDSLMLNYATNRDFPALPGTSHVGVHLRFGTVSARQIERRAAELNAMVFQKELVWREFFMMILYQFPQVLNQSFRPEYDRIQWRNNPAEFRLWCEGRTGYPIVDAGMRELNATGFMHNRVRMAVASFLCKHLLIDWRWGEAYFAAKLIDYDLSANNGNWQWAAGSGCDAAPWFRIFNPLLQAQKFDGKMEYIKRWIPELLTGEYAQPMVPHEAGRDRAKAVYSAGLGRSIGNAAG